MHKNVQDKTDQRFGRLVAVEYRPDKKKWLCVCDCGRGCYISGGNLRPEEGQGQKSCGCLRRDNMKELGSMMSEFWKEKRGK